MVLRTVSLLPEKSLVFLKSIIENKFNKLLKDEVVALVAVHQEEQITNARLQILINKNSIEVSKILNKLMDKDLLKTEGQGRDTRYLLSDKFQDRLSISKNKLGNNEDRLGSSEKKLGTRNDISEDILKRIKEISLPAKERKRLDRVTMEKIIIELCSIKPMSVEELSELLQRDGSGN